MSEQLASDARILLTSAGAITSEIKNNLISQVDTSVVNVLRFSDGWQHFEAVDRISIKGRAFHSAETRVVKWWSDHWLKYVFGDRHRVRTVLGSSLNDGELTTQMSGADIIYIPGGNTYLTADGLGRHAERLRAQTLLGSFLLLTESAGTIFAGNSLDPASIEPADQKPDTVSPANLLGLVEAQIVVHAPGRKEKLALPLGRIASKNLELYETSYSVLDEYLSRQDLSTSVIMLNDAQALKISDGNVRIIGESRSEQEARQDFGLVLNNWQPI